MIRFVFLEDRMWRTDGAWALAKWRQGDEVGGCYHCQGKMTETPANVMVRRVDRLCLVYPCVPST